MPCIVQGIFGFCRSAQYKRRLLNVAVKRGPSNIILSCQFGKGNWQTSQISNNHLSLSAMKNLLNNTRLGSYVFAVLLLIVFSCKDDKEPVPQGNLIFYTNYTPEKYDRIDIIIDGKVMGSISETAAARPECNAPGTASVLSLMLPVGTYAVSGKRYKGGEQVGNWKASSATVTAEECKRIRLVE
jgi:hypothetical protein